MRRHPWITATVSFVVLSAVLFFCLEWRAEKRWQRYAADARARGVKLLLTEFARPEIPDEQNFAALPMFRKIIAGEKASKPFDLPPVEQPRFGPLRNSSPRNKGWPPSFGDPLKGEVMDWVAWQQYFQDVAFLTETSDNPPRDVLRALEYYAPQFQEWSEWRTRPECRFPLDLTQGMAMPLSHLGLFQRAVKVFTLRMRAHLALGDSAAAYTDFQDGLQSYRALEKEPTLIAGLVRVSVLHVLLAGVGSGLKSHVWTTPELAKIERDLVAIQEGEDWRLALRTERGVLNTTVDSWLRASLREKGSILSKYHLLAKTESFSIRLIPRCVIRDNQLRLNHYFDELETGIDAGRRTFDPDRKTPSSPELITNSFDQYHYIFCAMYGRGYDEIEWRFIAMQTLVDEVRLACALERFRAKQEKYPEKLEELVPEFIAALPPDVYARIPYRYQRVGDISFRLYSVGPDRRDDGGRIAPGVQLRKQADAIWLYAPSVEP